MSETFKFPKYYYEQDLCKYLNINPSKPYYKKDILNFMLFHNINNFNFNGYLLTQELINIIHAKSDYQFIRVNCYLSKYHINKIIDIFKLCDDITDNTFNYYDEGSILNNFLIEI